ncbi:MAG: cation:proton antiporter [Sulfurovum sp.]|nr:cation:proton antiporter [Sulfurovum sp.]MCB4744191.1 cation:proton antiporter [Sulfurovum sp.]MCB4746406.1 cation:proton antiporter [Sulfurovum sp.]MCB4749193.1 cation:proton antiporter [Sulfurovum sp.]MCB4750030.1 cation:proton antiporter [Sulfurovum sp.]
MIHTNITLILTLSLLIWSSPFMSKFLRMPIPAIEIILGSLFAFLGMIEENSYFDLIAEVGFLYLMFLAGMEVDLKQITRSPKDILHKSILFLFLITLFSVGSGLLFNLNTIIIISMPLISIGLLASLSKTYGKEQLWIKLAFITGVLGEILSIAVLTIFDAASTTGLTLELLEKIAYLATFMVSVYLLYKVLHLFFWWFPEFKRTLVPKFNTSDQDIRLAMALFFILIAVMLSLDLELALGSFIAGVAISAFFHHEKELEKKMSSLGFGFLVPLFFIHVGASFDIRSLAFEGVLTGAILITFLMILSRVLAAVALKHIYGSKEALLVGLSLSMPLTLLVAVATIGYETTLLDLLSYYQLILASIFEILIVMVIIKTLQLQEKKSD